MISQAILMAVAFQEKGFDKESLTVTTVVVITLFKGASIH